MLIWFQVDHLIVRQKKILTAWVTKNNFDISDNAGTELFKAAEQSQSNVGNRLCCGAHGAWRTVDMMIHDLQGNALIQVNRPFAYCDQVMSVCSPPGNDIGSITQEWAMWSPKYTVKDQGGKVAFIIGNLILHNFVH